MEKETSIMTFTIGVGAELGNIVGYITPKLCIIKLTILDIYGNIIVHINFRCTIAEGLNIRIESISIFNM